MATNVWSWDLDSASEALGGDTMPYTILMIRHLQLMNSRYTSFSVLIMETLHIEACIGNIIDHSKPCTVEAKHNKNGPRGP
jgi:hypothetical protein